MPIAIVFGADRAWRLACAESLRSAGYQVRLASAKAEAMKAVPAAGEALVIIDTTASPVPTRAGLRVWARGPGEAGAHTAARVLTAVANDQPTSSA